MTTLKKEEMDNFLREFEKTPPYELINENLTCLMDFQLMAMTTCMDSCKNAAYPLLGLCEETAELADKMLKAVIWDKDIDQASKQTISDHLNGFITHGLALGLIAKMLRHGSIQRPPFNLLPVDPADPDAELMLEQAKAICKEMGDVNWNINTLAYNLGMQMSEVVKMNIEKLRNRKKNNEIDGKGDEARTKI